MGWKHELLQTRKFVYLRSTYFISVHFVGSKLDSREPKKFVNYRSTYRLHVPKFGAKYELR